MATKTSNDSEVQSRTAERVKQADRLTAIWKAMKESNYAHVEPVLPLCCRVRGKPMTLEDHFVFEPMFSTSMPLKMTWKCARQVGKSQSLAARMVLQGIMISYFNQLYVAPLYEMSRRMSSNVVKPLIDESPMRSLIVDGSCNQSVLQRSFLTHSNVFFSYASLDATRIRGIPADHISFDECFWSLTPIYLLVDDRIQARKIIDVRPGDIAVSFDGNGIQRFDRVVKQWHAGRRHCFRIVTRGGRDVVLTSNSYLATAGGWQRVSKVIEDYCQAQVHPAKVAATPRLATRRRVITGNVEAQRKVSEPSRLGSTCIQLAKVPGVIQVRTHSSQESEERWLRSLLVSIRHTESSGVHVLVSDDLPPRPEAGQQAMAECHRQDRDLAGNCLVGHGRRRATEQRVFSNDDFAHGRLSERGRAASSAMASVTWNRLPHCQNSFATESRQAVLRDPLFNAWNNSADRANQGFCCAVDAIQIHATGTARDSRLLQLSKGFSTDKKPFSQQVAKDETLLRQRRMRSSQTSVSECDLHNKESRTDSAETAGELLRKSRSRKSKRTGKGRQSNGRGTQQVQCLQESLAGKTESRLVDDEIVLIEYAGLHDVYDIETEHHHAFLANGIGSHNSQDFDPDVIPIINETMQGNAERFACSVATGTPKTNEAYLQIRWEESSQAEWHIRCEACGKMNIPAREFDLDRMIGPKRLKRFLSEAEPGILCAKCQRPVFPRTGRWIHRYPDRRYYHAGYHVPRILMPGHYRNTIGWREILVQRESMAPAQFYNEVCGESYDFGVKLVTKMELEAACQSRPNTIAEAERRMNDYLVRVVAVDWSGGGEDALSTTVAGVLGIKPGGQVDVLFAHRFRVSHDYPQEAKGVATLMARLRCDRLIHDYGGAGALREQFLYQIGIPQSKIIPVVYQRLGVGPIMRQKAANPDTQQHAYYQLDKARSLIQTCLLIRYKKIRFFESDYGIQGQTGLLHDFLSLVEHRMDSLAGSAVTTVIRAKTAGPDDFAQMVNIGVCGLFEMQGYTPDLAEMSAYKYDEQTIREMFEAPLEWEIP